jgi:hypothetical protein
MLIRCSKAALLRATLVGLVAVAMFQPLGAVAASQGDGARGPLAITVAAEDEPRFYNPWFITYDGNTILTRDASGETALLIAPICGGGAVSMTQNGGNVQYRLQDSPPDGYGYSVNPCGTDGGSDLPGAKVNVTFRPSAPRFAGLSFGALFTLRDDDSPPTLEVHPVPEKGHRVKAGQIIEVTVTARDDYPHTWETGTHTIQLLANDGLVAIKDYGQLPKPCKDKDSNVTWKTSYTVPTPAPAIVHLRMLVNDYVDGHDVFKTADFPTGDWYGTLKAHGQGNIHNDDAIVELSFSVADDGTVKGGGHARMTNAPQTTPDGCINTHTEAPIEFDFPLTGSRVDDEFRLVIPTDLRSAFVFTAKCPTSSVTSPPAQAQAFSGVSSEGFFHPRVRAEDGATNTFHSIRGIDVTGSIVIHSAKN